MSRVTAVHRLPIGEMSRLGLEVGNTPITLAVNPSRLHTNNPRRQARRLVCGLCAPSSPRAGGSTSEVARHVRDSLENARNYRTGRSLGRLWKLSRVKFLAHTVWPHLLPRDSDRPTQRMENDSQSFSGLSTEETIGTPRTRSAATAATAVKEVKAVVAHPGSYIRI